MLHAAPILYSLAVIPEKCSVNHNDIKHEAYYCKRTSFFLLIFPLEENTHMAGPYYPLGTIGTVPRAYYILRPTKEWKKKQ
jgi:hypothetical protein